MRVTIQPAGRANLAPSLILAALLLFPGTPGVGSLVGRTSAGKVEFICRIGSTAIWLQESSWTVYLYKTGGKLVRRAVTKSGESVKFKNLDSGIYMVCIAGARFCERCESVDLTVSDEMRQLRFETCVQPPLPQLHNPETHLIRVDELEVKKEARQEVALAESADVRGGGKMETLGHLLRALEISPRYTGAINNLGAYWHREGQYALAIKYFSDAISINPQYFLAWVNLSASFLADGQKPKALDAGKRALSLRPENPAANANLAVIYYAMGEYDQAKAYFRRLLDLDPANARFPQLYLYTLAMGQGSESEAEEYLSNFLKFHPNLPIVSKYRKILDALVSKRLAFQTASP